MILSDISIKRPVFTTMVMVGLMTLGLVAARSLGVDLFPDVSFPVVTVVTTYPGAGPEEIEQLVTKPIEEAVSSTNGVDKVRSYSRDSVSTVVIQYKLDTNIVAAAADVRGKVAAIRGELPDDIEDPVIQRIDPTALPILTYVVSSNRNPAETRRLAEDVIQPRLEAVDGVGSVKVIGGLTREIHVYADPNKLQSIGLSLAGLSQKLTQEGFDLPGGHLEVGGNELSVKTLGRYRTLDDLRSVVVASLPDGTQVKLSDVAHVVDGYAEQRTATWLNGRSAVSLQIQKQGGTNTVAIANAVYKVVDELRHVLPKDVTITKAVDSSTWIHQNIDDVSVSIVYGGAMAVLVIFLFMLDWRSTLISSLSLPTSVVTTFFVMWLLGFSFNMMTLLALSLAIGLLIDDAVVVREVIFRHMELGEDAITAAKKGTSEIGLAVLATTFTIVAVFVPVAFMNGIVGQFFRQFGLTVAAAVLVSLFVSFTLDPMMSARVMKPIPQDHQARLARHRIFGPIVRFYDGMDRAYRSLLEWAIRHRGWVLIVSTVIFFGTFFLTPFMGKTFMSPEDQSQFQVRLEAPAATSLKSMEEITRRAEALLHANRNVTTLYTTVGPDEEINKANLMVFTVHPDKRPGVSQADIESDVRHRLAALAGIKVTVAELGMVQGPAQELPITLYVRGDDYALLQKVAKEALAAVKSTPGTADVDWSFRPGKPQTNIEVNRAKAADLGVSVGTVAQSVRIALQGAKVAKFRADQKDYDIRLQLPPGQRRTVDILRRLTVPSATGKLVRISDVADVKTGTIPATIERMDRQRQIIVSANVVGRSLGDAVSDIQAKLSHIHLPPGFVFEMGGQAKNMKDTFTNMVLALAMAVLFIYFVLASQFESFIHPFTIMVALPLALVGALGGLFLTAFPISMPAMIGIILLMGLVTKNAILLVDYANELRGRGKSMLEALLEAGPVRLRPILMTSAAMILGMLPNAISRSAGWEFRAPMAIAVIGGVITSTFLTLLVVPVVYTYFDRFTRRGHHEKALAAVEPPPSEATPAARPAAREVEGT